MGAIKKRNITKIQSRYVRQHEMNEISASRRKTLIIRRLIIFSIFVTAISYVMITTLISQSSTLEEIKQEKQMLDQEFHELQSKETVLKEEIVKLNDDEYIAKLARKEYFLSAENEIIFSIPKEKEEKSSE